MNIASGYAGANPTYSYIVAEIVYLPGFSEPSTFYRAFNRWEGLTPVEYRRRKQDAAGG